ncbi:putative threonine ammonia-lyase [Helianthus annuus]|nr:putative threonine ammonia-lyase [Helianthus annuus]
MRPESQTKRISNLHRCGVGLKLKSGCQVLACGLQTDQGEAGRAHTQTILYLYLFSIKVGCEVEIWYCGKNEGIRGMFEIWCSMLRWKFVEFCVDMFEEKRSILEPAGALALAGAEAYCRFYNLKDANVVAITSGANMNFDRLRVVSELANVGRQQEAVLATFMPEEPGSIKQFCNLVGPISITEFKYRFNPSKNQALILYSVGVHTKTELQAMMERMKSFQLETIEFTNNDMVKDHLRHLVINFFCSIRDICKLVFFSHTTD